MKLNIDQHTKEKLCFGFYALLSIGASAFVSFVLFAFMSLEYDDKHKSTAGDRDWTGRDIILGDIESNLMCTFFLMLFIATICLMVYKDIVTHATVTCRTSKVVSGVRTLTSCRVC